MTGRFRTRSFFFDTAGSVNKPVKCSMRPLPTACPCQHHSHSCRSTQQPPAESLPELALSLELHLVPSCCLQQPTAPIQPPPHPPLPCAPPASPHPPLPCLCCLFSSVLLCVTVSGLPLSRGKACALGAAEMSYSPARCQQTWTRTMPYPAAAPRC